MSGTKAKDIQILLADYMNILPPGPQTAYVPAGDAFGAEESWPITPELERRMDDVSLIGETYQELDDALVELNRQEPVLYNAILQIFLHPEAGHSDLEFIRRQNPESTLLACADEGLEWLGEYMNDERIFVRRAAVADSTKREQEMEHKHEELAAVYMRYIESGIKHSEAIKNLAVKYEKDYTKQHIRRIIKERVGE